MQSSGITTSPSAAGEGLPASSYPKPEVREGRTQGSSQPVAGSTRHVPYFARGRLLDPLTAFQAPQVRSRPGRSLAYVIGLRPEWESIEMDNGDGPGPANEDIEDPHPHGEADQPLTPMQQAVVDEVSRGQEALGHEMFWRRLGTADLVTGGIGGWAVDNAIGDISASAVAESNRAASSLAVTLGSQPLGEELHVPAGGPPTPEEVHEAEMNPWPHHNMAETIEHNRQLRASESLQDPSSDESGPSGSSGSL